MTSIAFDCEKLLPIVKEVSQRGVEFKQMGHEYYSEIKDVMKLNNFKLN